MAISESTLAKREEEFRRADNERTRRFFNAKFDDIPAALQGRKPAFPAPAEHVNRVDSHSLMSRRDDGLRSNQDHADKTILERKVEALQKKLEETEMEKLGKDAQL